MSDSQGVRLAARMLRRLADRLDDGDYDRIEFSNMTPVIHGQKPVEALIVHLVAWKAAEEQAYAESEDGSKDEAVQVYEEGQLQPA